MFDILRVNSILLISMIIVSDGSHFYHRTKSNASKRTDLYGNVLITY